MLSAPSLASMAGPGWCALHPPSSEQLSTWCRPEEVMPGDWFRLSRPAGRSPVDGCIQRAWQSCTGHQDRLQGCQACCWQRLCLVTFWSCLLQEGRHAGRQWTCSTHHMCRLEGGQGTDPHRPGSLPSAAQAAATDSMTLRQAAGPPARRMLRTSQLGTTLSCACWTVQGGERQHHRRAGRGQGLPGRRRWAAVALLLRQLLCRTLQERRQCLHKRCCQDGRLVNRQCWPGGAAMCCPGPQLLSHLQACNASKSCVVACWSWLWKAGLQDWEAHSLQVARCGALHAGSQART